MSNVVPDVAGRRVCGHGERSHEAGQGDVVLLRVEAAQANVVVQLCIAHAHLQQTSSKKRQDLQRQDLQRQDLQDKIFKDKLGSTSTNFYSIIILDRNQTLEMNFEIMLKSLCSIASQTEILHKSNKIKKCLMFRTNLTYTDQIVPSFAEWVSIPFFHSSFHSFHWAIFSLLHSSHSLNIFTSFPH